MRGAANRFRQRRRVALDAAMVFVIILLIVQMWLLTATLEGFLAGHHALALPAALVSAVLFAACFGLYVFIGRADRASRRPR